jgi:uncharacterized protein (TIGR03437 family)
MLPLHWKIALATCLCAAAYSHPGLAQVAPPTILEIEVANQVQYYEDTANPLTFGIDSNVTTRATLKGFFLTVTIADIVAVNGQPAKGTFTRNVRSVSLTPTANPGQAVSDTLRNSFAELTFEILQADGTPIGTIMSSGLSNGAPPPGATSSITRDNFAIVGGTGAFIGARGLLGQAVTPQDVAQREASITEDPANRRRYGGGLLKFALQVIPMFQPQIVTNAAGPAIFHADFTPVTAAKPAKSGEALIVTATGLGPTVPGVNPGQPFPSNTLQRVNSPLAVSVNGKPADIINGIGWPGLVDTYRVDFRVPDGTTPGTAAIQLTAAWIAGPLLNIPIQ